MIYMQIRNWLISMQKNSAEILENLFSTATSGRKAK